MNNFESDLDSGSPLDYDDTEKLVILKYTVHCAYVLDGLVLYRRKPVFFTRGFSKKAHSSMHTKDSNFHIEEPFFTLYDIDTRQYILFSEYYDHFPYKSDTFFVEDFTKNKKRKLKHEIKDFDDIQVGNIIATNIKWSKFIRQDILLKRNLSM